MSTATEPGTQRPEPAAQQPATTRDTNGTTAAAARAAAVLEPGLDQPVRLVGARLSAAAAALLLAVGAGAAWVAFGTLPHTLALPALVAHGHAPLTVRTDRAGALLAYRTAPGDQVTNGQEIAVIRTADGTDLTVRAPAAGTVGALLAAPGSRVEPGTGLLALDASGAPETVRLYATTLHDAGQLVPGRAVLVPVPGRGTVRAVITAVDPLPARADSLAGAFPVPVPGLPAGAAPVWTAYADLPDPGGAVAGPVPVTAALDLGARHPYQAVLGTGARR